MYKLEKSTTKDIDRLIEYKKQTILAFEKDITEEQYNKVMNYIVNDINDNLDKCKNIVLDDKIIGMVMLTDKDDGKLLDELYIEEEYRNQGIGTDIIKNILKENKIVYLWVYKANEKAISLYNRLGFKVVDETEYRYLERYINE